MRICDSGIPDPPGKVDVLNADANTAAKDKRIAEMVKTLGQSRFRLRLLHTDLA